MPTTMTHSIAAAARTIAEAIATATHTTAAAAVTQLLLQAQLLHRAGLASVSWAAASQQHLAAATVRAATRPLPLLLRVTRTTELQLVTVSTLLRVQVVAM
jgi:hypothetical protein